MNVSKTAKLPSCKLQFTAWQHCTQCSFITIIIVTLHCVEINNTQVRPTYCRAQHAGSRLQSSDGSHCAEAIRRNLSRVSVLTTPFSLSARLSYLNAMMDNSWASIKIKLEQYLFRGAQWAAPLPTPPSHILSTGRKTSGDGAVEWLKYTKWRHEGCGVVVFPRRHNHAALTF
jgi:hypothetical protein